MNKITIDLEYGCYPVWIYHENGELAINDLPWELSEEKEIDEAFLEIQNIYDGLFVNCSAEPKYSGFKSEEEKLQFIKMIDNAIDHIKMKTGDIYIIDKKFDLQKHIIERGEME
jgi:hypothetical protein